MYEHLVEEMKRRNAHIQKYRDCDTISDLNKKLPESDRYRCIYVFADEFSYYMEDGTETDEELYFKTKTLQNLVSLVKQGRSAQIFVVVGLQRPDKENIPPIFKSQLCVRIAFFQNNTASSLVVVDTGDAVKLQEREAIVRFGGREYLTVTPYLTSPRLMKIISQYSVEKPDYIDLSYAKNLVKTNKEDTKKKGNKNNNQQNRLKKNSQGKQFKNNSFNFGTNKNQQSNNQNNNTQQNNNSNNNTQKNNQGNKNNKNKGNKKNNNGKGLID